MLKEHPAARIVVFAIWQPMLASDWAPPSTSVLARIADPRVQQYWDPEHLLATRLAADARAPQPIQDCCVRNGILWDLAALYRPGSRWEARLPPAAVFNGPVVDVIETMATALTAPK